MSGIEISGQRFDTEWLIRAFLIGVLIAVASPYVDKITRKLVG